MPRKKSEKTLEKEAAELYDKEHYCSYDPFYRTTCVDVLMSNMDFFEEVCEKNALELDEWNKFKNIGSELVNKAGSHLSYFAYDPTNKVRKKKYKAMDLVNEKMRLNCIKGFLPKLKLNDDFKDHYASRIMMHILIMIDETGESK